MSIKSIISSATNWQSLKPSLDLESNQGKGDTFELLTELYFKLNPKFENKYDDVWNIKDVPSKVLEKLGLPSEDLGIDLILRSGEEYHAVQCKYHGNKKQSVTFKEVSTFLTLLESTKKLTLGYICSTAELTSRNFKKLNTKQITPLLSDTWESLDEEFFSRAKAHLKGKKKKLVPFKPRAHQTKALKQADKYFNKENHTRGKLIFPCGAGKSLTGFWLTQKLASKSTLIAVPSLSLVKQTLEVYLREIVAHKKKVKWLCICSDEGIGKNDDVVVFTQDLGVPCVTDPEYIENWLAENVNEEKVIFTTYQSGRIIAEISKKLDFTFDVGIFDEAHKTVGSDKKLFSHLLFSKNIDIDKRIFMTATERFYSGKKDDIISMDDEDIYGDTFALMTFKEAIELELLTDYKVITIDIQKSEIADFIRDNNLVQLNDKWKKETEARSLASMLALRKAMKRFNIKNAVSFHSSIEKARRNKDLQQYITETYDYQPIDTYTVSGKDATTKRNDIVQEFAKSDKALITNARCLTEGVDVPNIDCIVFADPRKSKVDIVQALGRALRKKEGKEWGYVILPVIYDNTTNEIDNDNFNEILSVVRGLASNDERIVEHFKDKGEANTKAQKETEEQFNFEVLSEYMDEVELSKQLQIKVWEKLSKFNWMEFEEAREYVRGLGLKNSKEWRLFTMSGKKPFNIPAEPKNSYRDLGWVSVGDWLGTGYVATAKREYWNYLNARKYVRENQINSESHWRRFKKNNELPKEMPGTPDQQYKNEGWKDWGEFLGTGNSKEKDCLPFKEARKIAISLNLNSYSEWRVAFKNNLVPSKIPAHPERKYKNQGWLGWSDWLGTNNIANSKKKFLSYIDASTLVKKIGVKTNAEFDELSYSRKRELRLPSNPDKQYKNSGWNGWREFLGIRTKSNFDKEFVSFENAKKFTKKHMFKSYKAYVNYVNTHGFSDKYPITPYNIYKNEGWVSLEDYLHKEKRRNKAWVSFAEAKSFIKQYGVESSSQYVKKIKELNLSSTFPSHPERTYKNKGWKGWKDFLGNE